MQMALKKIVFAPFAYILDKYRWDIFKGVVKPDDYNTVWWKMMYIVLIGP
jgi:peptidyl-dipeptidase A